MNTKIFKILFLFIFLYVFPIFSFENTENLSGLNELSDNIIDNNTYIKADFIYLRAEQDSMEVASIFDKTSPDFPEFKFVKNSPEYKPGFKFGVGHLVNKDFYWFSEYLFYKSKSKVSFLPASSQVVHLGAKVDVLSINLDIQSYWLNFFRDLLDFIHDISNIWKLDEHKLISYVGTSYNIGNKLSFDLQLGPNFFILTQSNKVTHTVLFFDEFDPSIRIPAHLISLLKSRTFALGPRIGINLSWQINNFFTIIGNVANSLLYAKNKTHGAMDTFIGFDIDQHKLIEFDYKRVTHRALAQDIELGIGTKFGANFKNNSRFILSLLYQFEIITKQNYMTPYMQAEYNVDLPEALVIATKTHSTLVKPSDLYFHGPVFTLQFDF